MATGDTYDEISQYFHLDSSWSIESINLLSEDVYINKHHSVLHTVVMGFVYSVGKSLSSFTFGAFLYTMLQVILLIWIFVFMFKYMKKIKVSNSLILFSILFIGLNPIVITYSICAIKDTPSAIFNLLYVIFLLQIVRNYNSIFKNKIRLIFLIITILMVLMLRNNGIHTFLLSFPWLFLIYRNKWKKILVTMMIPTVIFTMYNKIILPSFNVSDGSIRETLSVPIMQLARVNKYKPEVFTDKDKEVIDNVLNFEQVGRYYKNDVADDVKNLYNKDTTEEELKVFLGVWFKYFKKYPFMYIDSVVSSTYGYFYPEKNMNLLFLYDYRFKDNSFIDISSNSYFAGIRSIYNKLLNIYYKMPFFINKVAYYTWFLLLSVVYIIYKKKFKYIIPLTPLLAILLSCIFSPVNGSFRYVLPIIFSVPIILSIDYIVYKKEE